MSADGSNGRHAVAERIKRERVEFVQLEFTDIPGAPKSVTIPADRLDAAFAEGVWFDGSAVEGLARVAEHDLYLRPDLATFAIVPWETPPTARFIGDLFLPNGERFPADPRLALRTILDDAAERGFDYRVACELEFWIFTGAGRPLTPVDTGGYFEVANEQAELVCRDVGAALRQLGVGIGMTHHEVAPGQHEIDLAATGALALADAIVLVKTALRTYARRRGVLVSFMPKPIQRVAGSGLHCQQLLVDRRSGGDAFFAESDPYQLSRDGRRFIAGQLTHARGMCAVIAPLVNSYKRLMSGFEAPAYISWARTNRGSYIRVPSVTPSQRMQIELRAPDPSCNPYLALAVMLRAGLHGIEDVLALPEPVEETARRPARREGEALAELLPRTLDEALEALDWDPVVRSALGEPIYERFVAAKEAEWTAHSEYVSEWELATYLDRA